MKTCSPDQKERNMMLILIWQMARKSYLRAKCNEKNTTSYSEIASISTNNWKFQDTYHIKKWRMQTTAICTLLPIKYHLDWRLKKYAKGMALVLFGKSKGIYSFQHLKLINSTSVNLLILRASHADKRGGLQ